MHKLFLDTNIILDWVFDRKEFGSFAKKIIEYSEIEKVKLYTSAITISDFNYIAYQSIQDRKKVRFLIEKIAEVIQVVPTFHQQIISGIQSDFTDLEDAFQYYTATHIKGISAIITRNKKDFKHSKIKILTAEEYLQNYWL